MDFNLADLHGHANQLANNTLGLGKMSVLSFSHLNIHQHEF